MAAPFEMKSKDGNALTVVGLPHPSRLRDCPALAVAGLTGPSGLWDNSGPRSCRTTLALVLWNFPGMTRT